jgi:putative PIN family toxin of toxin-antitoxin system
VIRAVLDTNVLASGFVGFAASNRAPARLLRLWKEQRFELVLSADIMAELLDTFAAPYFRRNLTLDQIKRAELLLRSEATFAPRTVHVSGVATHAEDDLVLSAAVSARADFLVTGDRKLLQVGSYLGVSILAPRAFLDLLELTANDEP